MYLLIKNNSDPNYTRMYQELKDEEFITLDTEFERYNTYFAKPSLLQLAGQKEAFLIDLLSVTNHNPIKKLVENANILKVLHCGFQDLEILRNLGFKLQNCLDTQIALQFLGFGANMGFDTFIAETLGIKLDKTQQRSDWMERPLSKNQLQYAADDVILLNKAYKKLESQLLKIPKRYEWCIEDSNKLIPNSDRLLKTVKKLFYKIAPQVDRVRDQTLIFHILKYREIRAAEINKARKHVMHDNQILRMVKSSKIPQEIQSYVAQISNNEADQVVKRLKSKRNPLTNDEVEKVKFLEEEINKIAKKYEIPPRVVASQKDIIQYVKHSGSKLESGWRNLLIKEIYKEDGAK